MNELITQDNQLSIEAEKQIIEYKEKLKEIKEFEQKFNDSLKMEMEQKGIISYKDNNLSIAYIAETEREVFDKEAFIEKYPDVYKTFTKKTPVKSSVRITIKKGVTSENLNPIEKVDIMQIQSLKGECEAF